jgi:putative transposase
MKSARFSEEQIIAILKEQEAGVATSDVCCQHDISSAKFCRWKAIMAAWRCPMRGD